MINMSNSPVAKGMVRLSFRGSGNDSISIPKAAAIKAIVGLTKIRDPKNAKIKPKMVPSRFFPLLKGRRCFPNFIQKMWANPSPNVIVVMAT